MCKSSFIYGKRSQSSGGSHAMHPPAPPLATRPFGTAWWAPPMRPSPYLLLLLLSLSSPYPLSPHSPQHHGSLKIPIAISLSSILRRSQQNPMGRHLRRLPSLSQRRSSRRRRWGCRGGTGAVSGRSSPIDLHPRRRGSTSVSSPLDLDLPWAAVLQWSDLCYIELAALLSWHGGAATQGQQRCFLRAGGLSSMVDRPCYMGRPVLLQRRQASLQGRGGRPCCRQWWRRLLHGPRGLATWVADTSQMYL
jgi:hypothetical protein